MMSSDHDLAPVSGSPGDGRGGVSECMRLCPRVVSVEPSAEGGRAMGQDGKAVQPPELPSAAEPSAATFLRVADCLLCPHVNHSSCGNWFGRDLSQQGKS